jgi:hypothetical protein
MLPRPACTNPLGRIPLERDALTIVWFEEGDGAALVENGDILAVVPTWDKATGFEGYARDCIAKSPLAWPMPAGDGLRQRVQRAAAWWASWEDDGDPWTPYRDAAIESLASAFGEPVHYYASGEDEWPPLAVLRFHREDVVYLLTCGMGLRPQPRVELAYTDPTPHRRVELALAMDPALVDAGKGAIITWLGSQGRFPWHFRTFLGTGHTMPCDGLPRSAVAAAFNSQLWLKDPPGVPAARFPDFRGDPVSVLWGLPITSAERDLAEKSGSASLLAALTEAGHTGVFRPRAPVVPDQRPVG